MDPQQQQQQQQFPPRMGSAAAQPMQYAQNVAYQQQAPPQYQYYQQQAPAAGGYATLQQAGGYGAPAPYGTMQQQAQVQQQQQQVVYATQAIQQPVTQAYYQPQEYYAQQQQLQLQQQQVTYQQQQDMAAYSAQMMPTEAPLDPALGMYHGAASTGIRIDTSLPLDQLREEVRVSLDPLAHLDFVRYLVTLADEVASQEPDPRVAAKNVGLLHGEALKWAKRLADRGPGGLNGARTPPCPEAMVYLAECHGNGALSLPVDHEKAFNLYLAASKLNHPGSTYRVAVCYEVGAGTKRDASRAVKFYRKAAALGDPPAMYKLALILLHGELGTTRNPREGITMLKRAALVADQDNPQALHELALLHEPPPPPGHANADSRSEDLLNLILPDPSYALDLYTQAAQLGYAPSQYRLGMCFQDGDLNCPIDPKGSIMWFTRAAEQGHPDAELALSGWYLEGAEGVLPSNDEQAYAWARRAADKGLSKAEFAVGYYSEMGIGVPSNLDEARRWYQRAAAQGSRKAMERLQYLKHNAVREMPTEKRDKGDCIIM
ncbi:hypothetical protein AMAG_00370 [Allomyces macrogynus ATCC 38327]|uniref:HCP-like protein n=1 Tax=Allomyces macrogynus (strain ATCC 38327) TaxID=578462 RepID=A0A0L0RVC3_ALLM3|nr:hypothetical protein AMAG_00370 [Allomyces macrogynus ATCC 38327]|eukprot:KNE54397.1 hypothetical protein AMAG_00370 [Allomyces macrogynus ATCC 38327]